MCVCVCVRHRGCLWCKREREKKEEEREYVCVRCVYEREYVCVCIDYLCPGVCRGPGGGGHAILRVLFAEKYRWREIT